MYQYTHFMRYLHDYGEEIEILFSKISGNKKLLHDFLFDLLSPSEYKDLAVRLQIIRQLAQGLPHRQIAKNLKVSVATVTRGSRELANKSGGFRQIIDKYYKTPG